MDLHGYITVLRKRWLLILACALAAVAVAGVFSVRATPQYQSHLQFFVSTNSSQDAAAAYDGGLFSQARTTSYADIVTGPLVAKADSQLTKVPPSTIEAETSASAVANSVLLNVTVTDPSPVRAQRIAAAIGSTFPGIVQQVEASGKGTSPVKVSVVQPATYSAGAVSPKISRNVALAIVIGLLLGFGLAILRETLDTAVRSPEEIQGDFALATLGAIAYDPDAKKRPLVVQADPHSPRTEAFRQLRTNLQYVSIDEAPRSLVFTSSVPEEGKTTTLTNLAITMAQSGLRVIVVEGDLRRPRLASYLGLDGAIGLTSVLVGSTSLEAAIQSWGGDRLHVLPSGPIPPNPSELLGSVGMAELIMQLEAAYDLVLIDAPPLLPVTDAAVLASAASGAVIVVRHGRTRQRQLAHAAAALRSVEATIYGVVLTFVPTKGPDSYYYYGYNYSARKGGASLESTAPVQPRRHVAEVRLPQPTLNGSAVPVAAGSRSARARSESVDLPDDPLAFFSR